ncbi:MAG TPA: RNA polymerase sigma factor, partial [Candidatus Acidoferrum sp.]|nr:RNA polymerase sigma factor [Candidatus Acidoferrum sp.]
WREVPLPDDLPATAQQPPAEQLELRREILRAMNKLSPRVRAVVLLALVEEEPYQRIAQALGISENAVKVRVFRGVRILRKTLSQAGVHP